MDAEKILLDHGSGGKATHDLIRDLLIPQFDNAVLSRLDDSAVFDVSGKQMAFSTDTYVVDPLFFPGGNIGNLAVHGTVNDLAMCGATPLYLSAGLIIEEGFALDQLKEILETMKDAAATAQVQIVTGDTKVVPRGTADKVFINTSGVGFVPEGVFISGHNARPGDKIILSGTMADHGITILTQREGMTFRSPVRSDTAPLNHLVAAMMDQTDEIHVLRDPTRGGVGTSLNEIAKQSEVGIEIREEAIPIREAVSGICELLGFDPLYVANEGKLLAFVAAPWADAVLKTMTANDVGRDAAIIGQVVGHSPGKVFMKTRIGGTRIVDMLTGEQLPRIC